MGVDGGGKSVIADTEANALEGNASEAIVSDGITGPRRSSEGLLLRAAGTEGRPCGRDNISLRAWPELGASLAL